MGTALAGIEKVANSPIRTSDHSVPRRATTHLSYFKQGEIDFSFDPESPDEASMEN
jgi:hypothetical protein